MPDFLEHLAQFAVAPLDQHHFIPRVIALPHLPNPCRRRPHLASTRLALVDGHARAQDIQLVFAGNSGYLHQVRLFHARRCLGQLVGQFAIVGHQQQAFAHVVQAPHRVKPLSHLLEELHHGWPALRILHRGHKAARFIQHKIAQPLGALQQLPVHTNMVPARVGLGAKLGNHRAVHLHTPLLNHLLGLAPARHSALRQDFLQALHLRRLS